MKLSTAMAALLMAGACVTTHGAHAQSPAPMPMPWAQFLSNTGDPLAGGMVFTYAAGTTTPQASYVDSSGISANTNPVVLDAGGRASIWLRPGQLYRIVVQTAAGQSVWTADNVGAGPLDMATLDTAQTFTAAKQFNGDVTVHNLSVTGTCTGCGSGGGGGGTPSFSAVTSGTNTANLTIGAGGLFGSSGAATINFGSAAGHTTPVKVDTGAHITGSSCQVGESAFASDAAAGQNLYFCTATNTWTQQLNSGGGGGGAFSGLSSGTNTTAAMRVGSGASIAPTGSGTISSTQLVDANQAAAIAVGTTASAVDYLQVTNGATGSPGTVSVAASGSDASIRLALTGKGSGVLQLNSPSATVDPAGNLVVTSCTGCGGGGGGSLPVSDATSIVFNNSDHTKVIRLDASAIATGATRTLTMPNESITAMGRENNETVTGLKDFSNGVTASVFLPESDNAQDIGTNSNGIRAAYIYTPEIKELRVHDPSGLGNPYWKLNAVANGTSSWLTIADNAGSPVMTFYRSLGGPLNQAYVDMSVVPNQPHTWDLGTSGGNSRRNAYFDGSVSVGSSALGTNSLILGGQTVFDSGNNATVNALTVGGRVASYGGMGTAGIGMAPIQAVYSASALTTSISSTNLRRTDATTFPAGLYRVSYDLTCHYTAAPSSGSVVFTLYHYTQPATFSALPQIGLSCSSSGGGAPSTSSSGPGTYTFWHSGDGDINFNTLSLGSWSNATYGLSLTLEKLQ